MANISKKQSQNAIFDGCDTSLQRFFRRIRWIFFKSGMLSLALEHFLAMIPATILVPVIVNSTFSAFLALLATSAY